tara:strand:- start:144 stop:410 length:267 start_codon:yes stop_codon:yes gene_type:complete
MSKHRIPNDKWMEFISEIATQLTELNFHDETFVLEDETDVKLMSNVIHQTYRFTDDAQDFFNERYDEVETLLENTLDITNDKPEYYES